MSFIKHDTTITLIDIFFHINGIYLHFKLMKVFSCSLINETCKVKIIVFFNELQRFNQAIFDFTSKLYRCNIF